MKIQVKQDATCADVEIPAGEYWVSLGDGGVIQLTGRGQDYRVQGQKRPSPRQLKTTSVQYYSLGGPSWTLVVAVPRRGEYFVFIKYKDRV